MSVKERLEEPRTLYGFPTLHEEDRLALLSLIEAVEKEHHVCDWSACDEPICIALKAVTDERS